MFQELPLSISPDTSKEFYTMNKTDQNDNVCIKLIGNIKKFCSCLPQNLGNTSDTNRCKRNPKKSDSGDEKEQQTTAYTMTELQTPTFDQLSREAGETNEYRKDNGKCLSAKGTNGESTRKGNQKSTKHKSNRKPSLKCSKLRYNGNTSNDANGKLKCAVRLTGKDKGDLLITGEDGRTHTLSFRINKNLNVVPDS